MALITKRNKPKVKIVTGNVNKTKTGFTKKFKSAKTTATFNAAIKLSTTIPFNK